MKAAPSAGKWHSNKWTVHLPLLWVEFFQRFNTPLRLCHPETEGALFDGGNTETSDSTYSVHLTFSTNVRDFTVLAPVYAYSVSPNNVGVGWGG